AEPQIPRDAQVGRLIPASLSSRPSAPVDVQRFTQKSACFRCRRHQSVLSSSFHLTKYLSMKRLPSLFALALLGTVACAETPAPGAAPAPAAPANPPAAATPPAAGATPPAAGAGAAAKKPFSTAEIQKLKDFGEALEFNLKMGEKAKWKGKDDKELADM